MRYSGSLTDVPGIWVGHDTDSQARTGCTVVLCPRPAVCGAEVRGAAPGTREIDLLKPGNAVQAVNAILLAGGSAFGLSAADGVMRYCEEHKMGVETHSAFVPIVPAAVIYDLDVGSAAIRPDSASGYRACENASADPVVQGRVGVGAGATFAKAFGPEAMGFSGVGSASLKMASGVTVAALAVMNGYGDVYDLHSGERVAGAIDPATGEPLNTLDCMANGMSGYQCVGQNTTLVVLATDAKLDKTMANRLAVSVHDGYAIAIRPVHTDQDGDTAFVLSAGEKEESFINLCAAAVEVTARAIVNAVL